MPKYHISYDIYILDENKPQSTLKAVNKTRQCFGEFYKEYCGKDFTVESTFYISNQVDIIKTVKDIYYVFKHYARDNNVLSSCDIDIDICEIPDNPNRLRWKLGDVCKD